MLKGKPHLYHLEPYPPGKTIKEIQKEYALKGPVIKLNSNENPFGPSPKVIKALRFALTKLNLYPQASYQDLKKALAKKWRVSPAQIVLGNGSNEVIEFVFKALLTEKDEIIISSPSFLMYEKFAQIYGVSIKKVPLTSNFTHHLEAISQKITPSTKAIFLDHPHNPTGSTLPRKAWEKFLASLPEDLLLVIDEAYGEFIEDPEVPLAVEFLSLRREILVCRTFSKAYGLAGLRLGYGITSEELAGLLERVRQPFNLNLLAAEAGVAALSDENYLKETVTLICQGRKYLTEQIQKLGFPVYPSQANFIMVDFGRACEEIYQNLLRRGIILRPLKAYGFPTCLRITIGKPEENEILLEALRQII